MIIRHGTGGALDDSLQNLSWGTYKQNANEDRKRDGTQPVGEKVYGSKLIPSKVIEIYQSYGKATKNELGDRFGVSDRTICAIQNGETWRHITSSLEKPPRLRIKTMEEV